MTQGHGQDQRPDLDSAARPRADARSSTLHERAQGAARRRRDDGAAAPRRRRAASATTAAKARRAALDYDDLIAKTRQPAARQELGRLGAVQARRRHRPHPRRRGAGHEPRAVAGDPSAGARSSSPAAARASERAHAVCRRRREAVDLQLPGRRARACSPRWASAFAAHAGRAGAARWRRVPLDLSFRSVVAAAGGGRPRLRRP